MEQLKFIVETEKEGIRVDKYLALKLGEDYSRAYVKFLMDNSFVHVNGKDVKPSYSVHAEDLIEIELAPLPGPTGLEPEKIPLDVVFEDDWIIVINKPAGMVVHPGAGNKTGTLVNALLAHCGNLPETGDNLRPGVVHRLDKDTSGIIVAAKNARAHRSLSKQFQKRAVKKIYIAIVEGLVELDNGVIDLPLGRHAVNRKNMDVKYDGGKEAITEYSVLRRFDNKTLLQVKLGTGRTHQIRVHLKHIGHPVFGDSQYGHSRGIGRQALHAQTLGFTHPDTGKYVEFTTKIPQDMQLVLEEKA